MIIENKPINYKIWGTLGLSNFMFFPEHSAQSSALRKCSVYIHEEGRNEQINQGSKLAERKATLPPQRLI